MTVVAGVRVTPSRLRVGWMVGALLSVAVVGLLSATIGPAGIGPGAVLADLADRIPGVHLASGLSARQRDILYLVRLPRVALGGLVGGMLALAGSAYQGVFRNALADPYLLGVAAGGGLGATLAVVSGNGSTALLPPAAFLGAVSAVALTYLLGRAARERTATTLILAGVAVAAFLTAMQTYVQQRNDDTLRQVYAWILGRLSTSGWSEVLTVLPYVVVSAAVILVHRRMLDVMSVGDSEARALGVPVARVRLVVVGAATLGTAAVVAVSGLIGFVGIIVPHTIRLLTGSSHRSLLPLSVAFGGAFLMLADLAARTVLSPAELPIGVVTAFLGAPFFAMVLRTSGARG